MSTIITNNYRKKNNEQTDKTKLETATGFQHPQKLSNKNPDIKEILSNVSLT